MQAEYQSVKHNFRTYGQDRLQMIAKDRESPCGFTRGITFHRTSKVTEITKTARELALGFRSISMDI